MLGLSNPATLKDFDLLMETDSIRLNIPSFDSAWPKKYSFPRPFVASRISVHPIDFECPPHRVWEIPVSEVPGTGDIRLQLQLYGNVHGMDIYLSVAFSYDGMIIFFCTYHMKVCFGYKWCFLSHFTYIHVVVLLTLCVGF